MSEGKSFARRVALALAAHAAAVLPPERSEWAQAMINEVDHLPGAGAALRWAIGCVFAGYSERLRAMTRPISHISRWVLGLEMLLCFVPLTIGWLDGLFGVSGIAALAKLHAAHRQHSVRVPGDTLVLLVVLVRTILATIGPIGLMAAFAQVTLGRSMRNRWLCTAMVTVPILYGLLEIGLRFAFGGSEALRPAADDAVDFWSGVLLASILPALGAAHLLRLGKQQPSPDLGRL